MPTTGSGRSACCQGDRKWGEERRPRVGHDLGNQAGDGCLQCETTRVLLT